MMLIADWVSLITEDNLFALFRETKMAKTRVARKAKMMVGRMRVKMRNWKRVKCLTRTKRPGRNG